MLTKDLLDLVQLRITGTYRWAFQVQMIASRNVDEIEAGGFFKFIDTTLVRGSGIRDA